MGALDRPLPDGRAPVSEINGRWTDNIGSGRRDAPLFPHETDSLVAARRHRRLLLVRQAAQHWLFMPRFGQLKVEGSSAWLPDDRADGEMTEFREAW
jgi:hypothetical protein